MAQFAILVFQGLVALGGLWLTRRAVNEAAQRETEAANRQEEANQLQRAQLQLSHKLHFEEVGSRIRKICGGAVNGAKAGVAERPDLAGMASSLAAALLDLESLGDAFRGLIRQPELQGAAAEFGQAIRRFLDASDHMDRVALFSELNRCALGLRTAWDAAAQLQLESLSTRRDSDMLKHSAGVVDS
ncbi:MAG: hypothetical protein AB1725_07465 [Armatimonadota bacterium]